jgi:hypothetical protein
VDIFAPSPNQPLSMCHKSGQVGSWQPSPWDWEDIGGSFAAVTPAVASWGPNRLDVFGVGANFRMAHKSWQGQDWEQPRLVWEDLGGYFCSRRPVVVAWAANRLDIFALGIDVGIYHKSWDGQMWWPSQEGWEHLGGGFFTPWRFTGPLATVAFISGRLDVFCRGWDGAMYHKGWFSSPITEPQEWHPSGWAWEPLGGQFAL